jgi:3-phenylpropionate/trans-cinnamate dioxygenase ferredoxin component
MPSFYISPKYNVNVNCYWRGANMSFVKAAMTTDVPAGGMIGVQVDGKKLLISNVDGKFYAINGICTHMGGDLSKGKLEDGVVTCPRHGSRFDVKTGKNLSGPKILFLKLSTGDENAFAVKVESDQIMVDL